MKTAKKLFLGAMFAAILTAPLAAQTQTVVTGTILDPNGFPYSGGTIKADLYPPGVQAPTVNGNEIQGSVGPVSLNSTGVSAPLGSFSLTLWSNDQISPGGTQWTFTIGNPGADYPVGFGPVSFQVTLPITGASQDISAQLTAASLLLWNNGPGGGGGPGTVQSVGFTGPGCIASVTGSPITTTGVIALTFTGTQGGITYFSGTNCLSSTDLIAQNFYIKSGGASLPPSAGTIFDNGTDPPRSPNGLNVASAGLWREAQNANPGTTSGHLACLNSAGSVLMKACADNVTSGITGIAGTGAGNAGTVQLCVLIYCGAVFDNQSTPGDYAVPGTGSRLHDTGAQSITAGNENFYVYTANTGADTVAFVAPPGDLVGGGGIAGACPNPMQRFGDFITGGAGGSCARLPSASTLANVPQFVLSTFDGSNASSSIAPSGINARAVTGTTSTDTIVIGDRSKRVDYQGSVSVATALDTPTNLGGAGFATKLVNDTTGSNTLVTVTAGGGATIKVGSTSASTLVIPRNTGCLLTTDITGTTYDADCSQVSNLASRHLCTIDNDTQSVTPLTDAQISGRCQVPNAATLVEIETWASGGTPSVLLERFRPNGATTADLLSAALPTGAAGIFSCATATISQTCIIGITSSGSITLSNTSLNAGDVVRVKSATAGGVATWDFISVWVNEL